MIIIPDWCYHAMETLLFVFWVFVLVSAAKKGSQWLATLLYGSAFGFTAEILNISGEHPAYHYATDKFWCIQNAPIWVGLGWGIVTYAAVRTARLLEFQQPILPEVLWRPLAAGYLAVSLDITLDPVAHALRFWEWHCDCVLTNPNPGSCPIPCPVEPEGTGHLLRYFGVPFDNFAGSMAIVFTYSLSVFVVSAIHRYLTKKARPGARPLHHLLQVDGELNAGGENPDAYPRSHELFFVWVAPLISFAISGLFFWVVLRGIGKHLYGTHASDEELRVCLALFVLGGAVTGYVSLITKRTQEIDWMVFFIPLFFHGVPIVLLLFAAFHARPELFLRAPANLALSMLVFTWPFQDKLVARGRALVTAWERDRFAGFFRKLWTPNM